MKLSAKQIKRLVKQGEVVQTECKDASGGLPDSLWESYSAFANTDGGVILFGAKEVDGKFSIADYHGRQGIVVEKRFNEIQVSNPGTMRISKEIAIEGGRSDPRNAQVFNIFSLIGIGERSGTGLSNLYALWEQHGFSTPIIREEFDPEKTIVNIATEPNQSVSDNTRTEPDHNPDTTRTELDNNSVSTRTEPVQNPYRTRTIPEQGESVDTGIKNLLNSLNSSTRRVYHELAKDGTITMRGLATKLGVNKDTINIAVGTLVAKKLIRRIGSKKGGHWEVVK